MKIRKFASAAAMLALVAASAMFTSCNDFLDQDVKGNNLAEDFYDTRYKLQASLNAAYDILQTDEMQEVDWRFGEACGDHVIGTDEGLASHMGQLVNFRFNTSNDWIRRRWEIYYKGIHRVNQVIANIDRARLSTDDYNAYREIREILGQAKFLRAYFYFNLARTYGGVPIRPEVETVDNLVVPRSSLEDTYAYIEKDLREAAILLPPRYTSSNSGKAGCGAAVALLMKVLLYQAPPGEYSDKWEQIVQLGNYFVKGDAFSFAQMLDFANRYEGTEWDDLRRSLWFKPQELLGKDEAYETLESACPVLLNAFSLEYKDAYGNPITYDKQFYLDGEFCQGSVFEIVFKESGDGTTDDTNEGSGIFTTMFSTAGPIYSNSELVQSIFGNDYRRNFTIGHHEYTPDMENTEIGSGRIYSLKWYTPIKDRPVYSGDCGKNRRVLRYVDVVLTYAEALNETGRGSEALEQLNSYKSIVNRMNNSTTLYVGGGYGYMRDQIWKEREIETAFEWERFFDIVRQGRAKAVLDKFAATRPNKRGSYFREGINEIFPIPQNEIDVSNGVVTQNPGY